MTRSNINLTDRVLRIIRNAENEVKSSKNEVLRPEHLLLACFQENTGVLGEISLKCDIKLNSLRTLNYKMDSVQIQNSMSEFFNVSVSNDVLAVMELAIEYMKKYKQVYLNVGHLLKALININVADTFLTEDQKQTILTLGTTSRDMITHLGNYTFPETTKQIIVRKINRNDYTSLFNFVDNNFSSDWIQTIKDAFLQIDPSIFIALDNNGEVLGFACYDVYKNKKCYFGPMGVSITKRINGIGYSLLHHCLKEMKEIGYEYAIIGGAGPIEFYEKTCKAVVIPYT
ncbi:GNAT family N-acetyltransferase [Gottfriedia solisilvae]|uniref:N-acetyltransferase n=1 Tax=Gottfriedia solisilvae TaxID=1516104 RepID=A0A8J3EXJ3_9BACI|nr:GNAT family N-acetyltransferase [Gottfriedia solisilvae]GGI12919.1 N-acetyltransferase [Gottfriedia solisilvae]